MLSKLKELYTDVKESFYSLFYVDFDLDKALEDIEDIEEHVQYPKYYRDSRGRFAKRP